jgi:hypothetical protein
VLTFSVLVGGVTLSIIGTTEKSTVMQSHWGIILL